MIVLASVSASEIVAGVENSDADGRLLRMYVDQKAEPYRILVIGRLLFVSDLDEGLRILVLGPPGPESPTARTMFCEQHSVLDTVMEKDKREVILHVLNKQVWCQGTPSLFDGAVYVRISAATTQEICDLAAKGAPPFFASFAKEVPSSGAATSPLATGGLVVCAVDMFRVDMPVASWADRPQPIYARAYGLNASSVVRFISQV
ncbi:hypothetical protein B0H13DRAFT_2339824 [Mycena leptocephala]|nr:hypothetical protein B0H13DRAFT_2339824 [Mycena leptocephala]